jgi:hypothetical protein
MPAAIWFCNGLQEVFNLHLLPYGFAMVGWRVVANQINFMVAQPTSPNMG